MNGPGPEFVELFLQEASEHLQFLREYSGILLDPYPMPGDIERLYISAHGIAGTAGTYGYPQFSEVAGKLAHIFQYAMNASVSSDAAAPLVEFITEGIAVLESDLIAISENGNEAADDILAFKQRYPFAFQAPATPAEEEPTPVVVETKPNEVPVAPSEPEMISDEAPLGDLIGEAEPLMEEPVPAAKAVQATVSGPA
jgi:chemotaxis protein histidine kinase CheA